MVSRDEHYRLVWCEPMTKIAERFDVPGSYLARVCTLLNVPRQVRYMVRFEVGPLPGHAPEAAVIILVDPLNFGLHEIVPETPDEGVRDAIRRRAVQALVTRGTKIRSRPANSAFASGPSC